MRGELSGHYFTAEDDRTVIRDNSDSGYYTDILALDGSGYVSDLGSGDTIQAKFDADYDYWDIGYRILSDIRLQDERFTITPSVGISYVRLDEEYGIRYRNISDGDNFNFIDEEVSTWFIGPTLGAQLHFQATPRVSLQIGGTAWLTYADSDYDARQTYFPDDDNEGSRASDSRTRFAFRGTLAGSASYDSGWAVLSLSGGLDYWDYAPVIQHPVAPLGESYSSVGPTAPARLGSDSMLNYFIGLKVSAPFDIWHATPLATDPRQRGAAVSRCSIACRHYPGAADHMDVPKKCRQDPTWPMKYSPGQPVRSYPQSGPQLAYILIITPLPVYRCISYCATARNRLRTKLPYQPVLVWLFFCCHYTGDDHVLSESTARFRPYASARRPVAQSDQYRRR